MVTGGLGEQRGQNGRLLSIARFVAVPRAVRFTCRCGATSAKARWRRSRCRPGLKLEPRTLVTSVEGAPAGKAPPAQVCVPGSWMWERGVFDDGREGTGDLVDTLGGK